MDMRPIRIPNNKDIFVIFIILEDNFRLYTATIFDLTYFELAIKQVIRRY